MMPHTTIRSGRIALTRVEVLVVVCVIPFVLALVFVLTTLVPHVNVRHTLSTRTVCASNLRGVGQAMYIYAQDGDKFPVASGISETSTATYWAYRRSLPPSNSGAAPSVTA